MRKPSFLASDTVELGDELDDLPAGPPLGPGAVPPEVIRALSSMQPQRHIGFPRFSTAREAAEAWCARPPSVKGPKGR